MIKQPHALLGNPPHHLKGHDVGTEPNTNKNKHIYVYIN